MLLGLAALAAAGLAGPAGCSASGRPQHGGSEGGLGTTGGRFDLPPHDFIYAGMDTALLKRLVGEPDSVEREAEREVWYYAFGVVVVRGRTVEYKYPPSRGQVPPPGDESP